MKNAKKILFHAILAALFALIAAPGAFAARSAQDIYADKVMADLVSYLKKDAGADVLVAVAPITDETGRQKTEAALLRQLLYGDFAVKSGFKCVDWDILEGVLATTASGKPTESLSPDALKKIGVETGADFMIGGRFYVDNQQNVFQAYLFKLSSGILVYTPIFDSRDQEEKPAEKTDKEEKPKEKEKEPEKPKEEKPKEPDKETKPAQKTGGIAIPKGETVYFNGEKLERPILDFDVFRDLDGSLSIAFLTTGSFDVFKLAADNNLAAVWQGEYKKPFPKRGTAASLNVLPTPAGIGAVVAMNPFKYTFKYTWDDRKFKKTINLDDFVVDSRDKVEIVSKYGKGVISFDGASTYFRINHGSEAVKIAIPLAHDYYDACLLSWEEAAPEVSRIATVDESGILRIVGSGGKQALAAEGKFGGGLDCTGGKTAKLVAASSASSDPDTVILMAFNGKMVYEVWRSKPIKGAIIKQKFFDLDGDGDPEVFGVMADEAGKQRLFAVSPAYNLK